MRMHGPFTRRLDRRRAATGFLAAVLPVALVAACATEGNFRRMLDAWVGKPDRELVMRMGPPDKSFVLADGSKVLQWTTESSLVLHCTLNFVVAPSGRVASYSYDGNSCKER